MSQLTFPAFPIHRASRLRQHAVLRDLVRENRLHIDRLVLPLFIKQQGPTTPIDSMPGFSQLSLDDLPAEIDTITHLQIPAVILFGIPSHKDREGSDAFNEAGIIATAIRQIKKLAPNLLVMVDVCMCEYTDHGHCGIMQHKVIDNDATLEILGRQAVNFAKAGADVIAPSGMMDGMVGAIRRHLDEAKYSQLPILSYAAKFCSAYYGPFRDAVVSAPQFGDRKTYQLDPANGAEALREVALDVAEGADMLMVKPAMGYLDIIYQVKTTWPSLPLAAYQVSGEFAMIKAASALGYIDEKKVVFESLLGIHRAGADFIITYFAKQVAEWLLTAHE